VAIGAVAVGCAVVGAGIVEAPRPAEASATREITRQQPARPDAPLPPVEPLTLIEVPVEDAVAINAAVPFSKASNPAARPLFIKSDTPDYQRSVDCLAAATYYEAAAEGDDAQRAVAQVVINRMRHPAFPNSICDVVFQGSERATGCQFTFTCDGSLRRQPSIAGWKRAREIAAAALNGKVFKPVGHSTHYHTNWVVPYWSASLDKVTSVGTHLFFRWTGGWGRPPAFGDRYAGTEPAVAKIAGLSSAHAVAGEQMAAHGAAPKPAGAAELRIASDNGDTFLVVLDGKAAPNSYPALALATCASKDFCKFMGWTDKRKAAKSLPLADSQHSALSFSYLRNKSNGFEKMLWNCRQFPRPDPSQCMVATAPAAS
jgi:spore germination cell wall hydrolase CwlJ-like protein